MEQIQKEYDFHKESDYRSSRRNGTCKNLVVTLLSPNHLILYIEKRWSKYKKNIISAKNLTICLVVDAVRAKILKQHIVSKTFDSIHREKMEKIQKEYDFHKESDYLFSRRNGTCKNLEVTLLSPKHLIIYIEKIWSKYKKNIITAKNLTIYLVVDVVHATILKQHIVFKTFDSIHREKMEKIQREYDFLKATFVIIITLHNNMKAMVY